MAERGSIFPKISVPSFAPPGATAEKRIYKPAPFFDYSRGDFVKDGANRLTLATGREAYIQWCLKQCVTERYTRLAYSSKIGVEIQSTIKKETDIEAVESIIEQTITDALLVNPATEYVRDFSFAWDGSDSLGVTFQVKGKEWPEDISLTVKF